MSQNPKTFVKPNKQRQPEQKRKNRQGEKQNETTNETQNSNDRGSTDVRMLTIEEQLECFADLLIDLYLLDQQPNNDHEN